MSLELEQAGNRMQEAEMVERPHPVAGGDAAELFEAADSALHRIATSASCPIDM
jgi:hypothetical protein